MPFNEWPEPEKIVSFDELQRGLAENAGLEDVPGFTKEADFSAEVSRSVRDTLYADTGLLNETLEIERHIDRLWNEEKRAYVVVEKSLRQMGYQTVKIRSSFHKMTGIDPVKAFLDTDDFPIPPGAVPRANYGWGEAKEGSADYFFVLPWINHYGVFKLTGMHRELVSQHVQLDDARAELKKKVKAFRDVTPDGADTLTDILQKVAEYTQLSAAGAEFFKKMEGLVGQDPHTVALASVEALDEGKITKADFQAISKLVLAGPQTADSLLSAPERIDQRSFEEFRDDQEGRSFQEMKDNVLMPGQMFASDWEQRHKVDFWGLLTESHDLFDELRSTIQGFKLEPTWGSFRIMPEPNLAVDEDNHILDGSVSVGATVQKLGSADESEVAILMFIHGGKLKFSGKFKGVNDREYALTTVGLESYFDDLEGSSAIDNPSERGVSSEPMNSSPMNAPSGGNA